MNVSKILKFVWLVSFAGVSVMLFYIYAGLPEMVAYAGEPATSVDYIDKEMFFYIFLVMIALINVGMYFLATRKIGLHGLSSSKSIRVVSWEFGLGIVVNIFLSISMIFISVFNSGEKFDYSNFGYLVYFSFGLIVVWIISLPFVIQSARVRV